MSNPIYLNPVQFIQLQHLLKDSHLTALMYNTVFHGISLAERVNDMVKENAKPKKGEMMEDHKAALS